MASEKMMADEMAPNEATFGQGMRFEDRCLGGSQFCRRAESLSLS